MSRITLNDYYFDAHNRIGRGSSGVVYLGYHQKTRDKVAIKRVDITNIKDKMSKLWNEIHIMKELNHSNVIKLYDVYIDIKNEYLYLIMEYCDGSDLSDYIGDYSLDLTQVHQYITQLRDGLYYLHQKGIVHRDLKPHNLLLRAGQIKIADFGLSANNSDGSLMQTMCGSPLYMSPEIIEHQKYTAKSDLWSIGIILYQMIYHHHPYQNCRNFADLTHRIKTEKIVYPNKPPLDSLTMDLLQSLLCKNCHNRISWNDFFNHAWFKHELGSDQESIENSLMEDSLNMSLLFKSNESLIGSDNRKISVESIDSGRSIGHDGSINDGGGSVESSGSCGRSLNLSQFVVENYNRTRLGIEVPGVSSSSKPNRRYAQSPIEIRPSNIPGGRLRTSPVEERRAYGVSAPTPKVNHDTEYSPRALDFSSMGSSLINYISHSYDWIKSSIDY